MNNEDFPSLFVSADAASNWGQRMYRRIFAANMIFIIVGSLLAFAAELTTGLSRVLVAAGAAFIFLPGVLSGRFQRRLRDSKKWFEGRAIAETVKSLSWRYMMCIPPFDEDDAHADAAFADAIVDMNHEGLGKEFTTTPETASTQMTNRMREIRSLSFLERRDLYAQERLHDQVTWYQRKSEFNRQRSQRWWRISAAAQAAAVISAVGVIFTANAWVNVVGIFGAVAAAATAWTQLSRHDELTKSYDLAAKELANFENDTRNATTDADLIEAVRNGEGAISREHTLWVAKRGDPHEIPVPKNVENRQSSVVGRHV